MNRCRSLARELVEEGIQDEDVYQDGPYSFVVLETMVDGKHYTGFGFSKCGPNDEFSEDLGEKIAYGRAVQMVVDQLAGKAVIETEDNQREVAGFIGAAKSGNNSHGQPGQWVSLDWGTVEREYAAALQLQLDAAFIRALYGDTQQRRQAQQIKVSADNGRSARTGSVHQPGLFHDSKVSVKVSG